MHVYCCNWDVNYLFRIQCHIVRIQLPEIVMQMAKNTLQYLLRTVYNLMNVFCCDWAFELL